MAQILRYGIRHNFEVISFLVVSTAEFCENIAEGLLKSASIRKYRILVHKCEFISDVIAAYKNLHVDFIVFAFDSRQSQCLHEVEQNIFLVDQSFVLYGQACLVNGNNIATHSMGSTTDKILEFYKKYNLRLLSANVFIPEDCLYLGNQIINLASAILGQKTGYPLLNAPKEYHNMINANDTAE